MFVKHPISCCLEPIPWFSPYSVDSTPILDSNHQRKEQWQAEMSSDDFFQDPMERASCWDENL